MAESAALNGGTAEKAEEAEGRKRHFLHLLFKKKQMILVASGCQWQEQTNTVAIALFSTAASWLQAMTIKIA